MAPRSTPVTRRILFAVLGSLCIVLALRGDVFWRLSKNSGNTLRQLGGTCMYTTDVQVNGAPGTLSAYTFGLGPTTVSTRLARTLGLKPSAAFLTHTQGGRMQRMIVLPSPATPDACLVLAFDQTQANAAKARQKPAAWPSGVPALAATPLFTAVCAKTRATFVTAESDASPEAAVESAAQTLQGAGWTEAPPSIPGFKLFVSDRKQCVVFAHRAAQSGRTEISLLQREGSAR